MSIILNVHARQIFDSRGNPTVEVDVITDTGTMGRALAVSTLVIARFDVPAGVSF